MTQDPIKLLGAPGSPYTRKMLALLRYRRIPHAMLWGGHMRGPPGLPEPKVKLLPTFYLPRSDGTLEAVVDSTPIARRLEADFSGRAAIPAHPALAFLNYLIEDYADEWLTKSMFHFRWAHAADAENAAPLLIYWSQPQVPAAAAAGTIKMIGDRQIGRLYVVGSNAVTARTIEDSYRRFVALLDEIIERQGYVLGGRPSTADFALYGQLTQLAIVEPTSAAITKSVSQRVRAWVDRLEDLSGLEPEDTDWLSPEAAAKALAPFLAEIGRTYAPFLVANAAAAAKGEAEIRTEIDGRPWTQPTFPYQVKCLGWIRDEWRRLGTPEKTLLSPLMNETGCSTFTA